MRRMANDYENKRDIVLGIFVSGRYIGNIGLHDLLIYGCADVQPC